MNIDCFFCQSNDEGEIIDDLTKRDYIDKNRQLSPLVSAKDAYLLDTSNITSDDGLKKIIQIISKKLEK